MGVTTIDDLILVKVPFPHKKKRKNAKITTLHTIYLLEKWWSGEFMDSHDPSLFLKKKKLLKSICKDNS